VVNVLLGPPVSVNVALEIAKARTTVTVTEEAPLVQAENGDVSTKRKGLLWRPDQNGIAVVGER
jgi:hypothetical protein